MSPESDFVVSPKPPSESRYEFPASVLNVDGSVCMLIPPGSYSPLKQLVAACGLSDEPSSYPIVVAALIQCGHSLVCSPGKGLCVEDGVKECPCVDCTSQDLLPPSGSIDNA